MFFSLIFIFSLTLCLVFGVQIKVVNALAYTRAYFESGLKTLIVNMLYAILSAGWKRIGACMRIKCFKGLPVDAHTLSAQQETFPFLPDFCQDGISLQVFYIAV